MPASPNKMTKINLYNINSSINTRRAMVLRLCVSVGLINLSGLKCLATCMNLVLYFSLYSFGVIPTFDLKTLEKYAEEEKPVLLAISPILKDSFFKRYFARCNLVFKM